MPVNQFLPLEQLRQNSKNIWNRADKINAAKNAGENDAYSAVKGLALTIHDDLEYRSELDYATKQAILSGLDILTEHKMSQIYSKVNIYNPTRGYYQAKKEIEHEALAAKAKEEARIKEEAAKDEKSEFPIKEVKAINDSLKPAGQAFPMPFVELTPAKKTEALHALSQYLMTYNPLDELKKAAQTIYAQDQAFRQKRIAEVALEKLREDTKNVAQKAVEDIKKAKEAISDIVIEAVNSVTPIEDVTEAVVVPATSTADLAKPVLTTVMSKEEFDKAETQRKDAEKLKAYAKLTLTPDETKVLNKDESKALEILTIAKLVAEINALTLNVKQADLTKKATPKIKHAYWKEEIANFNHAKLKHVKTEVKSSMVNQTVTFNPPVPAQKRPLNAATMNAIHAINPNHHAQLEANKMSVEAKDWAKAAEAYTMRKVVTVEKNGHKTQSFVTVSRQASYLADESHLDDVPSLKLARDLRAQDPVALRQREARIAAENAAYREEYSRLVRLGLTVLLDAKVIDNETLANADKIKLDTLKRDGLALLVKLGKTTHEDINAVERVTLMYAPNSQVVTDEELVKPEAAKFKMSLDKHVTRKFAPFKRIPSGHVTHVTHFPDTMDKYYEERSKFGDSKRHVKQMPYTYTRVNESRLGEKDVAWAPHKSSQLNGIVKQPIGEKMVHPKPETKTSEKFATFQQGNYANRKVGSPALNKTIDDVVLENLPTAKLEQPAEVVAKAKLFNESKETKHEKLKLKVAVVNPKNVKPVHEQIRAGAFGLFHKAQPVVTKHIVVDEAVKVRQDIAHRRAPGK